MPGRGAEKGALPEGLRSFIILLTIHAPRLGLQRVDAVPTVHQVVLPAGSVANLYPFNYSGKTDPQGFYVGRDRYGSSISSMVSMWASVKSL